MTYIIVIFLHIHHAGSYKQFSGLSLTNKETGLLREILPEMTALFQLSSPLSIRLCLSGDFLYLHLKRQLPFQYTGIRMHDSFSGSQNQTDKRPTDNSLQYEYTGAIHIHSNFSDGLRPIPEITEIAGKSGIDFLLFADHMTLEPLKRGLEGWHGSVLAIIGYEINDENNNNHYLAYGLDEILPTHLTAQEYVRRTREEGGTGFIAHPDEKRTAFPDYPPYPWTAWDAVGYDGIEIWNHSSEWMESLTRLNKYYLVLHPLKFLKGPAHETLERWDRLNKSAPMPGIGGLDAHAYPYRVGPITIYIFRYKVLFKGIRTHILTHEPLPEDGALAKTAVLSALKNARCYISNFRWGDARGFRFDAVDGGIIRTMGETITGDSTVFRITTPLPGRIILLRDGKPVTETIGRELIHETTEPGAYRVEVRRKRKPWIYSNHIRLLRQ